MSDFFWVFDAKGGVEEKKCRKESDADARIEQIYNLYNY
jgi:hypothetical protein